MRYLCLVYHDARELEGLPRCEYEAIVDDVRAYRDELRQSGQHIVFSPLQSLEPATTIRVHNGHIAISDGPYATTREQLGGFFVVTARDLNEVIRMAARMTPARRGVVEVRPIHELEDESPP